MSLINDALKKAQRERDEAARATPPPPPPPPSAGTSPAANAPRRSPLLLIVGAALIAAGSTWLTVRLTSPAQDTPAATGSIKPATGQTAAPAPSPTPTPAPAPSPLPAPTPTPLFVLSAAAEQARTQAVVDRLTITAVRLSDSGNRALVNDRLLRVGDPLEGLPGVRVQAIESDRIDFVDTSGRIYTKRR